MVKGDPKTHVRLNYMSGDAKRANIGGVLGTVCLLTGLSAFLCAWLEVFYHDQIERQHEIRWAVHAPELEFIVGVTAIALGVVTLFWGSSTKRRVILVSLGILLGLWGVFWSFGIRLNRN